MRELCFGQRIDKESGLVESWFTHGALDAIKAMDLSDKVILQYGSGLGDAWLSKRCKRLVSIERKEEWLQESLELLSANRCDNAQIILRPCNDSSGMADYYCEMPDGLVPDVIIVDDAYRYECAAKAVGLKRPLILIIDNHQQDYVFICPALDVLLKGVRMERYIQKDHKDHEGNPWATAIFYL